MVFLSEVVRKMITKYSCTNEAKVIIKKIHNQECMINDTVGKVDGAHIYPAGSWAALKCYPGVIFPMMHGYHLRLDHDEKGLLRTPVDRLEYIWGICHPNKKWLFRHHVEAIKQILIKENYPGEVEAVTGFIEKLEIVDEKYLSRSLETSQIASSFQERPRII